MAVQLDGCLSDVESRYASLLGSCYARPNASSMVRGRGGMDRARGARTLITNGVAVTGGSVRDPPEVAVQLGSCLSEVESRSASVLQAIYPRPVARSPAP